MGDGRVPAHRAGARRPGAGPPDPAAGRRARPPRRPRLPVPRAGARPALAGGGILAARGRGGDCPDNAGAASFFVTRRGERLHRQGWPTRAAARLATVECVAVGYNRQRRHSTLDYLSPAAYEALDRKEAIAQYPPAHENGLSPPGLYHKVHVGVAGGRGRIIAVTAIDVTAGEIADEHLLGRLCRAHQGATGATLAEVVADAKQGMIANYRWREAQGIQATIPPHENGWADRAVPRGMFVYDPVADRSRCPNGQLLTRQGTARTAHPMGAIIYRAAPTVCRACAHKADYCGEAKARTITRPHNGGLWAGRAGAGAPGPPPGQAQPAAMAESGRDADGRVGGAPRLPAGAAARPRSSAHSGPGRGDGLNIKKLAQAYRPQPQPMALARRSAADVRCRARGATVRHRHRRRSPATRRHQPMRCSWSCYYHTTMALVMVPPPD